MESGAPRGSCPPLSYPSIITSHRLITSCFPSPSIRYLAKKFGRQVEVTGITLSPNQQRRAAELATEQSRDNAVFLVMDALKMDGFDDDSFDLVWACESGYASFLFLRVVLSINSIPSVSFAENTCRTRRGWSCRSRLMRLRSDGEGTYFFYEC